MDRQRIKLRANPNMETILFLAHTEADGSLSKVALESLATDSTQSCAAR